MNITIKETEKNFRLLEIEVDVEAFKDAMQKAFNKNMKHFSVPGFRKGRVPMGIVIRHYGEGVLYDDAIQFAIDETYSEAVEKEGIEVAARPEIDIVQIGSDKPFIYTAKVAVNPEFSLGKYRGLEVEGTDSSVSNDDVDNEIKRVAERNSSIAEVEDRTSVVEGDITIIDFEGFDGDVAFPGGKGDNYELAIGSNTFIPGFEEQIIGAVVGTEIDVNVSFPEEYHEASLAGKPVLFKVTVNAIKEKRYPTLDDEFAKDVSEFDTLEEYKADVKAKLVEQAEKKAKSETEDKIFNALVEGTDIEIPQPIIDEEADALMHNFDMELQHQGLNLQRYTEMMGMNQETVKEEFSKMAIKNIKMRLIIEEIGKIEKIDVSEEDRDKEIEAIATQYGETDIAKFKETLGEEQMKYFEDSAKRRKIRELIVAQAKVRAGNDVSNEE